MIEGLSTCCGGGLKCNRKKGNCKLWGQKAKSAGQIKLCTIVNGNCTHQYRVEHQADTGCCATRSSLLLSNLQLPFNLLASSAAAFIWPLWVCVMKCGCYKRRRRFSIANFPLNAYTFALGAAAATRTVRTWWTRLGSRWMVFNFQVGDICSREISFT